MEKRDAWDVIIVGGGMAGLAAAAYLGRAGRSVLVLERSRNPGGRATTQDRDGFLFNLGPHALYRGGRAVEVLQDLGVEHNGQALPPGGFAGLSGRTYVLPAGASSLLTTRLLTVSEKVEFGRLFASLPRIDYRALKGISVAEWLNENVRHAGIRDLLNAFIRLSTYANEPGRMSADIAIGQLQLGTAGVYYVSGGWQTLVDGLRRAAEQSGAVIKTRSPVASVDWSGALRGVRLADGAFHASKSVLIAAPPRAAVSLIGPGCPAVLRDWAARAVPVRSATMEIGLRKLPNPRKRFLIGIDRPLYFSVHSAIARLAPPGGAMLHLAAYRSSGESRDDADTEAELMALMDRLQPGWRDLLVARRFLPDLTVVHALPSPPHGLAGRPDPQVPDIPDLYVAGDWVGSEGWLLDASLASARRAAELILTRASAPGEPRRSAVAV